MIAVTSAFGRPMPCIPAAANRVPVTGHTGLAAIVPVVCIAILSACGGGYGSGGYMPPSNPALKSAFSTPAWTTTIHLGRQRRPGLVLDLCHRAHGEQLERDRQRLHRNDLDQRDRRTFYVKEQRFLFGSASYLCPSY